MSRMRELVYKISGDKNCVVYPAIQTNSVMDRTDLTDEIREFYEICNGIELFPDAEYPYRIVGLSELRNISLEIYEPCECDGKIISDDWFLIAENWNSDPISIDMSDLRGGMCCDCFLGADFHVISLSLYDLLNGLYDNGGGYNYWLNENIKYEDPCRN